jgi:hypothetical protein
LRKIDRRSIVVLSIGIIIVLTILIGTLDLFFGNGILGLLLYGIVLVSIIGGYSHGSNIWTGLGLVRRQKNLPRSRGKPPPFTFTINSDQKGIMHGMRTANELTGHWTDVELVEMERFHQKSSER